MRLLLVVGHSSEKAPIPSLVPLKVFLLEPTPGFVSVSSSRPSPQTREDFVIHARERAFADDVPMIIGPTSYFRVEFLNQIGSRCAQRGLDDSSDAVHEGLNVLLGRHNEQFSIGISAYILAEKVEAFFHVRDDRLRGREFKSTLLQKLLNEEFDFSFQCLFRSTGDDEVIRIPDEMH